MRVKVNPFPATYFSAICTKHSARLHLAVIPVEGRGITSQARIHALKCDEADNESKTDCLDHWQLTMESPGKVVIEH
jgi:hypothetical protein